MKKWTKENAAVFATIGASSHTEAEREKNDFYATEPKAVYELLKKEKFDKNVWECCCGQGHISKVLKEQNYNVKSTDLVYRGYGEKESFDFLSDLQNNEKYNGDIITNPPYKYAEAFVKKSLKVINDNHKVAMLFRIQFLESQSRRKLFEENPPIKIYIPSKRLQCAKNGDFDHNSGGAVCYAWFVWQKGYKGLPSVDWIN